MSDKLGVRLLEHMRQMSPLEREAAMVNWLGRVPPEVREAIDGFFFDCILEHPEVLHPAKGEERRALLEIFAEMRLVYLRVTGERH